MRVVRVHTNPHPQGFDALRDRLAGEDDVSFVTLTEGDVGAVVEILVDDDDEVGTREHELRSLVLEELERPGRERSTDAVVVRLEAQVRRLEERVARLEGLPAVDAPVPVTATHERAPRPT